MAAAYNDDSGALQQRQTTAAAYDGGGSDLHQRLWGGVVARDGGRMRGWGTKREFIVA